MRTALVMIMMLLTACSSHQTPRVKADRALTAEERRIVEIARQAVATNDTWVEKAEFETPQRNGSGWSITVWRLPATPGGFRTITINENGKVTNYYRGH